MGESRAAQDTKTVVVEDRRRKNESWVTGW